MKYAERKGKDKLNYTLCPIPATTIYSCQHRNIQQFIKKITYICKKSFKKTWRRGVYTGGITADW